MKATTIIIAAALTLQMNILFAANEISSAPVANANTTITLNSLAPSIPMEADFEDASAMIDFANLAPSTPSEAAFDEMNYEMIATLNLVPVNPAYADFEDPIDFNSLVPSIPMEADFE